MSAQGTQGEVDPLVGVGHEIPGANDGAQVIQLTQIEIAQIVSNAVSQALTRQIQQLGNSLTSTTAANHVTQNTSAAQQFQPPIKFDVPAFEGDSTASWLTWSQRVLYQARARILNFTTEQKEPEKYFVCPMKSTEKQWNPVVTRLSL